MASVPHRFAIRLLAIAALVTFACNDKDDEEKTHLRVTPESLQTTVATTPVPTTVVAVRIPLRGTVARGQFLSVTGTASMPTYEVQLELMNTTGRLISFDRKEAAFVTGDGNGLRVRGTKEDSGITEIASGDVLDDDYDTNGYTNRLLADARGGPLYFRITFYMRDRVVLGPFCARLPQITTLRSSEVLQFARCE